MSPRTESQVETQLIDALEVRRAGKVSLLGASISAQKWAVNLAEKQIVVESYLSGDRGTGPGGTAAISCARLRGVWPLVP